MKLVILMFLEDDAGCAGGILADHGVVAYTELAVEGHGGGAAGWYGDVAPFRSRMVLAFLPSEKAGELLEAVRLCDGRKDARHPLRAWLVDVEKSVYSGEPSPAGAA